MVVMLLSTLADIRDYQHQLKSEVPLVIILLLSIILANACNSNTVPNQYRYSI